MDNMRQWLIERKTIYFIFALLYDGKVNKALEIIEENNLLQNLSQYNDNDLLSAGSSEVIKEMNENKNNREYKDLVLEDHQKLFVGPDKILAPLWESVYKTKDKLLFGEIELEVRRYYNSAGLDVKGSEAADYLPFQLAFMSRLCVKALEDSFENINQNLKKQCDFLSDHLLNWINLWTEEVNKNADTAFWNGFAKLTKGWLENDLSELKRLIEA